MVPPGKPRFEVTSAAPLLAPAERLPRPARPAKTMAPKKAIAKKTTKRKAVAEVPAPAKKAAAPAGGKLEVVIEACKS